MSGLLAAIAGSLHPVSEHVSVMPAVKSVGTVVSGANPSVAWPAGTADGDFALLITTSGSQAAPAGWASVPGSPQTSLSVFWKFASGADSPVALTGTSTAVIVTYTAVNASPVNVSKGNITANYPAAYYPPVTTSVDKCLVVLVGNNPPNATAPAGTTADLINTIVVYHAPAETKGSYGPYQGPPGTEKNFSAITLALAPA